MNSKADQYWQDFYRENNLIPTEPSPFAHYVLQDIRKRNIKIVGQSLLDVGCGNGRDSTFFAENGFSVTALDRNVKIEHSNIKFHQGSAENFNFEKFDVIYCRFVFHAMTESDFDKFLKRIKDTSHTAIVYGETRGTEGINDQDKAATNFRSSIGEEHFRMLYSRDYLEHKISKLFKIIDFQSGAGFARYKDDNPVCHRIVFTGQQK